MKKKRGRQEKATLWGVNAFLWAHHQPVRAPKNMMTGGRSEDTIMNNKEDGGISQQSSKNTTERFIHTSICPSRQRWRDQRLCFKKRLRRVDPTHNWQFKRTQQEDTSFEWQKIVGFTRWVSSQLCWSPAFIVWMVSRNRIGDSLKMYS